MRTGFILLMGVLVVLPRPAVVCAATPVTNAPVLKAPPPRPLAAIQADLAAVQTQLAAMTSAVQAKQGELLAGNEPIKRLAQEVATARRQYQDKLAGLPTYASFEQKLQADREKLEALEPQVKKLRAHLNTHRRTPAQPGWLTLGRVADCPYCREAYGSQAEADPAVLAKQGQLCDQRVVELGGLRQTLAASEAVRADVVARLRKQDGDLDRLAKDVAAREKALQSRLAREPALAALLEKHKTLRTNMYRLQNERLGAK